MDEPIYEKQGDTLKITVPEVIVVSRDELEAEKDAIEAEITEFQSRFDTNMTEKRARLDDVNERIAKAEELGLQATPVVEEPVEDTKLTENPSPSV